MSLNLSSQLQWSVDQTAGGVMSGIKGLIQAATTDNVQPLALQACEQFGTILPVLNNATRIKIEQLARRKRNKPLSFMKAQVGFCAGDSADFLARTDGGLSFLCLAAILLCWGEGIEASELLESLVRQYAKKEQSLPTLLQLNDLLQALKPKLADSGFVRDVIGCYDWCLSAPHVGPKDERFQINFVYPPDAAGVQHLLDALNQCFRLGDESCTIRIDSTHSLLPWVIATTKWLLGDFPNVWLLDGSHFIKSSLPKISVFEARRGEEGRLLYVSVSRRLNSLDQLISTNETSRAHTIDGMIDAQLWIKIRIAKLALPRTLCAQMLFFVAKHLVPRFLFCQTMDNVMQKAQGIDIEDLLPSAFPDQNTRLAAMQHLLGENVVLPDEDPDFKKLSDDITKACTCRKCDSDRETPREDLCANVQYRRTAVSQCLESRLGRFAADLLSLTLFATEHRLEHCPMLSYSKSLWETPLNLGGIEVFNGDVGRAQTWEEMMIHGWRQIMMQKLRFLSCKSDTIFEHALLLMDHSFEIETVLSSANGQVVYPSILERGAIHGSAYLQFSYTPGCLRWNGSSLGALVSKWPGMNKESSPGPRDLIITPRPTISATGIEYSPTQRYERSSPFSLTLSELKQKDTQYSFVTQASFFIPEPGTDPVGYTFDVDVWDLMDGISQTIFSPACDHRQNSPIGALGEDFLFLGNNRQFQSYELGDQSLLINHQGDRMCQLLRLAMSGECCVLHREGCINCALALAKRLDVKMVIC
ncbi:MAG: hypothetical protein ASARMPREDX12_000918 [Alectoria sarmentosa]|nr:MAG: hypothetical protein ASARMPREDX12_000918 [Alectoria sarmentosa]